MRITKFPQSCFLIDKGDGALLLDPGSVAMKSFGERLLGEAAGVLVSHAHADHLAPDSLEALRTSGLTIHCNKDVARAIGEEVATIIADRDRFQICGFEIEAHDLPHFPMVDGTSGPPNTGFHLDDHFLHPGDAIEIPGSLQARALALPIAGPSVSFRDAYALVVMAGSEQVIPIHYDVYQADADRFRRECEIADVVVLRDGESTNL